MGRRSLYDISNDVKILELYKQNKSLNEIGKIIGVHHEVVKRRLVKIGVKIRGKSEAMICFHYDRRQRLNKK